LLELIQVYGIVHLLFYFIDFLEQMFRIQTRLLKYVCFAKAAQSHLLLLL